MYRFLLVTLLAAAAASTAHAQAVDPITVSVVPDTPRPYQTVTVTPGSTFFDPASALISISVNGSVIESGGGVQSVPITVAGPGEETVITIKAVVGADTYTKQITLRPADVALVVDAVSTVHPFYLGAPLVAPQGRARVVAIPDLRTSAAARINPAELVYTWRWGDQVLTDQSGIGRSVLTVTAPVRYRDADLSVTVTDQARTLVAEASTVISPVDPFARVYHTDPLMGPDFDHALSGQFVLKGEEDAFRGVAYFFGTTPSLSWAVNSQTLSSDQDVTVRTTGSGEGTATLSFSAQDSSGDQSASMHLPVKFGSKKPNIFGF
ncbi:MAG: hypothetical protein ACM3TU_00930 [Bacillota bacterium]